MFACFGYFLGHLWSCLTKISEVKIGEVIWLWILLEIYLLEIFLFEVFV